ncbi:hypothetical protein [Chitinimonas sp.]|uniref:hypothetical protein n=1 Tax=Chitinimonas sp. TaxID=1934313 RepID=UPI0035B2A1A5
MALHSLLRALLTYALIGAVLGWLALWMHDRLRRLVRRRKLRNSEFVFLAPYQPESASLPEPVDRKAAN